MTITEAIAAADALRPGNPYTAAQKTAWLAALDGKLFLNVVQGAEEDAGAYAYSAADGSTELLMPHPFADAYPACIAAQIDFADMEWEAYAASSRMYNSLVGDFARYYLRTHRPAK